VVGSLAESSACESAMSESGSFLLLTSVFSHTINTAIIPNKSHITRRLLHIRPITAAASFKCDGRTESVTGMVSAERWRIPREFARNTVETPRRAKAIQHHE
jgi:hypothetical protein